MIGHFLFPRRPLPRRVLLFCHAVLQLGLLTAGLAWLAPRTPWLAAISWQEAWPGLALGIVVLLLGMAGIRLLAELWLLPYHLAGVRGDNTSASVVTRSYERRPAVHDPDQAWTSSARTLSMGDDDAIGQVRVANEAAPRRRSHDEPTLDLDKSADAAPSTREPRL